MYDNITIYWNIYRYVRSYMVITVESFEFILAILVDWQFLKVEKFWLYI